MLGMFGSCNTKIRCEVNWRAIQTGTIRRLPAGGYGAFQIGSDRVSVQEKVRGPSMTPDSLFPSKAPRKVSVVSDPISIDREMVCLVLARISSPGLLHSQNDCVPCASIRATGLAFVMQRWPCEPVSLAYFLTLHTLTRQTVLRICIVWIV